jgi:Protein kinase domain
VTQDKAEPRDDAAPATEQKPSRPQRKPPRSRTEASGPGKNAATTKTPPRKESGSVPARAKGAGRKGATAAANAAAASDKIAGYGIEEQIGAGGMAVVYRARDERLGRQVALKLLAPGLAADEGFRQRFIRESRSAAAVDHPNIIPLYEAGESGGSLFIAMRYVQGGDVRSLLERQGPLSGAQAWAIISQVASALDAAHASGLVHRDVKPANMLLDGRSGATGEDRGPGHRAEYVYLSDFGISKQPLTASNLTMTGQFVGTLDYIAPEQIEGTGVDGRTDLYSLGCAAYELLSGTPPFSSEGIALLRAHLSEPPPPVTAQRHDLPAAVDAVLAAAMAKSPRERYATCTQFATNLGRALGLGSGEPELPGPPQNLSAGPGAGGRPWPATELAGALPQPGASQGVGPGADPGSPYYASPQRTPGAPPQTPAPEQVTMAPAGPPPAAAHGLAGYGAQVPPGGQWGPGGGAWPPQAPRRGSAGKIAGVAAAVVAVAAAAVVAVVLVVHGKDVKQVNDVTSTPPASPAAVAAPGSSAPSTSPSPPSPPASASVQSTEATAVSALLATGNGSADNLNNAINDVASCGDLPTDLQEIQQVENQRQNEYDQAQNTQMSSLPNGAALKSDLVNALYYSLQADQAYLAYANQMQQSGCQSGSQSAALAADNQAVTYKDMFISLWNPIATGYGLPTQSQASI